jgi:hypothetical protein
MVIHLSDKQESVGKFGVVSWCVLNVHAIREKLHIVIAENALIVFGADHYSGGSLGESAIEKLLFPDLGIFGKYLGAIPCRMAHCASHGTEEKRVEVHYHP